MLESVSRPAARNDAVFMPRSFLRLASFNSPVMTYPVPPPGPVGMDDALADVPLLSAWVTTSWIVSWAGATVIPGDQ